MTRYEDQMEQAADGEYTAEENRKASKWADYADIQKLDRLFVSLATQEYAELYHKLASEYTEDLIMYQLNQYNSGSTW